MPRIVIVTRHRGLIDWLAARGIFGEHRASVDRGVMSSLRAGDHVIGPLPLDLAAELSKRDICHSTVVLDRPPSVRAEGELTAAQMDELGARLRTFEVLDTTEAGSCDDGRKG